MTAKPRYRLSTTAPLVAGQTLTLEGNAAHYLTHVLRLGEGDTVALFNRTDGEWRASITAVHKRAVELQPVAQLRPAATPLGLIVCFAPIKGGRMETIIEKATELGASVLQPVITARTIVDKMNLERAESIAREAAEQCERIDWPEIREPVKFPRFITDWPMNIPLIYGDETGASPSISTLLNGAERGCVAFHGEPEPKANEGRAVALGASSPSRASAPGKDYAILAGPEGGFTPEEITALSRHKAAIGVGLGPRILRADTAIITLCAITLAAWGDWEHAPRFNGGDH